MTGAAFGHPANTPVLDPVSRATEILFGLIMVLTFTASLNAAEASRHDVRLMLIGALGCNLAWGLIDAAMYLISAQAEKAMSREVLVRVQGAATSAAAAAEIRMALPPVLAGLIRPAEIKEISQRLVALPVPALPRLDRSDYMAALAVFALVFVATLPVALPFLVMTDAARALQVSHAIALISLFLAGYTLGGHWGRPWRTGIAMLCSGLFLVAIALALGG